MNCCQYYRAPSSLEDLSETFKHIAFQLNPNQKQLFLLTETQRLEDHLGSNAREELWETDHAQLCFRIQPNATPPHHYNIQFTLQVELSTNTSILCQLFNTSENPWLSEVLLWTQIQDLEPFDIIRQKIQQQLGIDTDETDSPKITVGNIESALHQNQIQIARIFAKRCWTQHYSPQKIPDQWWVHFCELYRTLFENDDPSSFN